jgi:hypothetical protein
MSSNPRTNSQQPSDALARKLKRYSTPAQSVLDSGAGDRANAQPVSPTFFGVTVEFSTCAVYYYRGIE